MKWRVPLVDLDYGEQEERVVLDVLRGRWLTMGSVTQEFEVAFAELLGVRYAIAVSNATMSLHLACLALGIGPGDEVIVPSLSFVATASAVLYTGARLRFADIIGHQDLCISPEHIEAQITPRTKAIMVMHYGGYSCRMDLIKDIAVQHRLALIEDAAHAPGAFYNMRALGTWGSVGCFSFFSNKNLATGEGGMLVTDHVEVAQRARLLRSHAMTTLTWDRHQGHAHSYDVIELGYNYRIDEVRSALGMVQLSKLYQNNARRKALTMRYREALDGTPVEIPFTESEGEPAYHIFPILLPEGANRDKFIESMREARVQTSIHYPPIHQFSYYRRHYPAVSLPQTESIALREVTLPLYPSMSDSDVEYVVEALKKAINKI
jgi:dTDP-4-amino-4,6-dideoxygalactose transaminase